REQTLSTHPMVAERLEADGVASLLFDLLTEAEDRSRATRFDIDLLTRRVLGVIAWTTGQPQLADLALHLFGTSTGAAAAIRAAGGARAIHSVVSRGGRPDLAGDALAELAVPCLLIVGGNDPKVLEMNRDAQSRMECETELRIVEGATHLFEEPGALDEVAEHASEWIRAH
ncbi:MAG: dienelactone hydrolase family protein, partial [Spirochaetota bacterium]